MEKSRLSKERVRFVDKIYMFSPSDTSTKRLVTYYEGVVGFGYVLVSGGHQGYNTYMMNAQMPIPQILAVQ